MTTISSDKPIAGLFEAAKKKTSRRKSDKSAYYLTLDVLFSRDWLKRQATMAKRRNSNAVPEIKAHVERITARLASFDAVVGRVFGTYEILEMILLQLPMKGMLLARRVNTTFKVIIDRSLQIQRALCFVPSTLSASEHERPRESRNTLLAKRGRVQLDPWKLVNFGAFKLHKRPRYRTCLIYELVENFCSRLKPLQRYYKHPAEASWRRMLLSQPSCDRVDIAFFTKGQKRLLGRTLTKNGFTTMDEVQEWLREIYTATAASKDWREYVDAKDTFKKNKDLIVPRARCCGDERRHHSPMSALFGLDVCFHRYRVGWPGYLTTRVDSVAHHGFGCNLTQLGHTTIFYRPWPVECEAEDSKIIMLMFSWTTVKHSLQ